MRIMIATSQQVGYATHSLQVDRVSIEQTQEVAAQIKNIITG